jgi:GT2 family glycosyltransferase
MIEPGRASQGRPSVSVVMPFAGSPAQAATALAALARLITGPGDELIFSDNSGAAEALGLAPVRIVRAAGERSPSHARNVGAEHAHGQWVLFVDADCAAPPDLLQRYFEEPVDDEVGALAGGVVAAAADAGVAARYGAARSFLGQGAHLAHPFMPRAVAANLMVRRSAFEAVGGFYEGVRAAEDTDFSWRLQQAGWRLEARPEAVVVHSYRTSVGALRRQWRGYAAGRAWLGRRYDGFSPEPGFRRATRRLLRRRRRPAPEPGVAPGVALSVDPGGDGATTGPAMPAPRPTRLERGQFLALDALLGAEELAGLALSNRPHRDGREATRVVLVAEHFPSQGDPLADFALSLAGARVEAAARPVTVAREPARALTIDYREDDGTATRVIATLTLLTRHPLRCALDRSRRHAGDPGLAAIAPAVRRLEHDRGARVHPVGGDGARAVAGRLAALTGRPLES